MAIFWGSPEALIHRGTAAAMDTVDYTDSTAAVHVDMAAAIAAGQRAPIFGGYAEGDRFISIEGVWGSPFADVIAGNGQANGLFGYGGSDNVTGAAGNDTLRGEGGGDTVNGGAGNDMVYGDGDADVVSGGEGNDTVFGGRGTDTVDGGEGADVIWGGKGDDLLIGGLGHDTLEGGVGADVLYGDTAKMNAAGEITGPGDPETWTTGAGRVEWFRDAASYTLSNTGVVIDLSGTYAGGLNLPTTPSPSGQDGTYSRSELVVSTPAVAGTPATPAVQTLKVTLKAAAGGHAAGDVLYGITAVQGSAHNDTLVGESHTVASPSPTAIARGNELWGGAGNDLILDDKGADFLSGEAGNDTILGGGDDDTLSGGAGADSLNGGAGTDTASYRMSDAGVSVDLTKQGTPRPAQSGGHAEGDTLAGFERISGSNHADFLVGDSMGNQIVGHAGDDWDNPNTVGTDAGALAADGTKTAAARGGLFGGAGADFLDGDLGNDLLAGEAGNDTLWGGTGNDYLHGGAGNDNVTGDDGDDTLTGGAGNDTVNGGAGNDVLLWEAGASDVLLGGAGNDTLDASAETAAVNGGGSNLPYRLPMRDIENFIGGSGNDHVQEALNPQNMPAVANYFFGGAGNDTLSGGDGADTLSGGLGADYLVGGAGNDVYVIARETGDTTGSRVKNIIGIAGSNNEFQVGDKIDIRALGVTAAQLATALRAQGRGTTKSLDFGVGKGQLDVVTESDFTGLTAADFII